MPCPPPMRYLCQSLKPPPVMGISTTGLSLSVESAHRAVDLTAFQGRAPPGCAGQSRSQISASASPARSSARATPMEDPKLAGFTYRVAERLSTCPNGFPVRCQTRCMTRTRQHGNPMPRNAFIMILSMPMEDPATPVEAWGCPSFPTALQVPSSPCSPCITGITQSSRRNVHLAAPVQPPGAQRRSARLSGLSCQAAHAPALWRHFERKAGRCQCR